MVLWMVQGNWVLRTPKLMPASPAQLKMRRWEERLLAGVLWLIPATLVLGSLIWQIYLARTRHDPYQRRVAAWTVVLIGSIPCLWVCFGLASRMSAPLAHKLVLVAFSLELVFLGVWALWFPLDRAMERYRGLPQHRVFVKAVFTAKGVGAFYVTSLGLGFLLLSIGLGFTLADTNAEVGLSVALFVYTVVCAIVLMVALIVGLNSSYRLETETQMEALRQRDSNG
jgi:hypothetical protein